MTTRTNPTMKEAETPKPARQEGAPHLDLAAPCLASSFSPARSSCRSSRPLPALPPPSSPRTSPSERTERGAEDGGRCSFVLSPFLVGAQVQQSSREPPAAVSRVPPPPHVRILAKFIRLLPLASYCVDATERRASAAPKATEIHKTRNPRPFTGFFFGLYMHPNRLLDLKIVFNQHPKPLNGITNVFYIGGRSGPVNFLFS